MNRICLRDLMSEKVGEPDLFVTEPQSLFVSRPDAENLIAMDHNPLPRVRQQFSMMGLAKFTPGESLGSPKPHTNPSGSEGLSMRRKPLQRSLLCVGLVSI